METLFIILLALVEIIAIVDVLRVALPIGKKAIWIMLVLFVPGLGIILYYLLGRPDVSPKQQSASAQ